MLLLMEFKKYRGLEWKIEVMSKWDPLLMHAKTVIYISPTRRQTINHYSRTACNSRSMQRHCSHKLPYNWKFTGELTKSAC